MKMRNPYLMFLLLCSLIVACTQTDTEKKSQRVADSLSINDTTYTSLSESVTETVRDMQAIFDKDSIPDINPFNTLLDSVCVQLKKEFPEKVNTPQIVDHIIDLIYNKWEITFDPDQSDLKNLLPHIVILQKRGSCLGVSLIFLLLAEKLDTPLFGVLLPGHFFIRYDDGRTIRNIEPNRVGYNHPLEYYRERYVIGDSSWYTMKNLSQKEVTAVLFYTVANIYRSSMKGEAAKRYYRKCVAVLDDFAEAWGNLAIVYVSTGQADSAHLCFNRAYEIQPKLDMLLQNIGAFELGRNNYEKALHSYREGLIYYPDNRELLYGMALCHYSLGSVDSAQTYLYAMGKPVDPATREFKLAQRINSHGQTK